eukprot:5923488-Ditylum_brightwellii.AAC.1
MDWPTGFTEGTNEVRMLIDKLDNMSIGEGDKKDKKIFTKRHAITWDNYFSGNTIFDYAGIKSLGLFMTVRWDRLPKGVPLQYFHKKLTDPGNMAAKHAHYNDPIVMAMNKEDPVTHKKYQKVHVLFQSTSSYNIQAVNMLSSISKFEETKERGI